MSMSCQTVPSLRLHLSDSQTSAGFEIPVKIRRVIPVNLLNGCRHAGSDIGQCHVAQEFCGDRGHPTRAAVIHSVLSMLETVAHRKAGKKVGDVQSLVFFTTPEVLAGHDAATNRPRYSHSYVENQPGRIAEGPDMPGKLMKEVLHNLLKKEWSRMSAGRQYGEVSWCEVDRRDVRSTYERVVQVIAALAGVGGQGKEMWVNLTGGNNVTNFALQLAATLSGEVARLYYVQAENQVAEKCVRFTPWVFACHLIYGCIPV